MRGGKETTCEDCGRKVGLLVPPAIGKPFTGKRKRAMHGDPKLPKLPGGRMRECLGSRMEVPDEAVTDVPHNNEGRRRLNRVAAS